MGYKHRSTYTYTYHTHHKKSILDIDYDLGQIKNKSEILIISPQPIGNEYRGVYNCLFAYKKESIITIPQYYSESLYNESETKEICKLIIMHEFKKIILGAFPFHYKNYAIILDQFREDDKQLENLNLQYNELYYISVLSNGLDRLYKIKFDNIINLNIDDQLKLKHVGNLNLEYIKHFSIIGKNKDKYLFNILNLIIK